MPHEELVGGHGLAAPPGERSRPDTHRPPDDVQGIRSRETAESQKQHTEQNKEHGITWADRVTDPTRDKRTSTQVERAWNDRSEWPMLRESQADRMRLIRMRCEEFDTHSIRSHGRTTARMPSS